MKKVNICVEIEKGGRGIYYGLLHRDDSGKLYAKVPSPLGPPTLTAVDNLQADGYTVRMVSDGKNNKKKGGKKKCNSLHQTAPTNS